jgi:hypothetical protein
VRVNKTVLIITTLLVTGFFCFLMFVNFVGPTEIGIARNRLNGKMWKQCAGVHVSLPWVWVTTIDTRPVRVSVTTAGHGRSGMLVQFNPEAWEEFVQIEGWHWYWWYNRLSFNLGYREEYRGMRDILRGHAYGAKKYSFLKILEEYQETR